jgi:hypothetical protein
LFSAPEWIILFVAVHKFAKEQIGSGVRHCYGMLGEVFGLYHLVAIPGFACREISDITLAIGNGSGAIVMSSIC